VLCLETVLRAAVGMASCQLDLEAGTVFGDCTVCSCRHSKLSPWVRLEVYTVYEDPTVCSCRHSKLSA